MGAPRLASIDVGSNTARLLIAEPHPPGAFSVVRVERVVTRLGGRFSGGRLDPAAMERTLLALEAFARRTEEEGVKGVFAVATGVVREAGNGGEFLREAGRRSGIFPRLLSGEEEGRLMLRGVLSCLREKGAPRLVVDVGGWSTEILRIDGQTPVAGVSLGLGAVALAEKFLIADPPAPEERQRLEKEVRGTLEGLRRDWEARGVGSSGLHPRLVGTAGTATTLAAVDLGLSAYEPGRVSGHQISSEGLEKIQRRLFSLPLKERKTVPGLEPGREDLILAGSAVIGQTLAAFGLSGLEVIDSGLLEGVFLEGMARMEEGE